MPHLLTGDFLFSSPTDEPSTAFVVVPIGFALILIASVLAYLLRSRLAPNNPVLRRLVRRAAKAGMWIGGLGIALCVLRYVEFDYLDAPILLLLVALAGIASIAYFVYDLSEHYPIAMWKLQEAEVQRRYRPPPRRRPEPQPVRSTNIRGKRRR
jgi:hypothetical protein